jgi:hypothetical protein
VSKRNFCSFSLNMTGSSYVVFHSPRDFNIYLQYTTHSYVHLPLFKNTLPIAHIIHSWLTEFLWMINWQGHGKKQKTWFVPRY